MNARFNAGELLLEMGRYRGLQALLDDAPEGVVAADEGLSGLAEELEAMRRR